ncbi:MAG: DUF177 domain-containing protein [Gammaproteobacteria bacterium]|nr:DUF177 domain-containing protein [Gammaproteobacteria bacterium]
MANPLLDRVRPAELADRGQVIEIKGFVGEFERLEQIVESDLAALEKDERPRDWRLRPVAGRITFRWLDARRTYPAAEGSLTAALAAVCQRCLEAFEMPLAASFSILFADGDDGDAAEAAPGYEYYELDDGVLLLNDVVEELLVMAMPLAPVHATREKCGALAAKLPAEKAETVRPFADLRAQIDRTKT